MTTLQTGITICVFILLNNVIFTDTRTTRKPVYNFNTTIKPSEIKCKEPKFLVLLVTSYVGHVQRRKEMRNKTPAHVLAIFATIRIFLLASMAENKKYTTQKQVEKESNTYGDILQGSFIDHYRNLTHKHLMGLRWAATDCASAHFIVKHDDDVSFDPGFLNSLFHILVQLRNVAHTNFLMGLPVTDGLPNRKKLSKWYISWKEYPSLSYPPYLKGGIYVTTPLTAARLCEEAVHHRFMSIDDVFVTGVLAQALNFKLKDMLKWNMLFEYYDYEYY